MMIGRSGAFALMISVLQLFAFWAIVFAAVFLTAMVAMALVGWLPWPELDLRFAGAPVPDAGFWGLVGLATLLLLLTFFLPAHSRMARLERSHRNFAMGIEDVARAYRQAHASDRAGVFGLSAEFDSVRARMEHLRKHPDLAHLEPELLQLAAQMSHQTRELARAYSDERVARARIFLQQRQEEVQSLTDRLAIARITCDELRRWKQDIDADERQAQVQLRRLEADLKEILPALGYDIDWHDDPRDGNVVSLPKPAK